MTANATLQTKVLATSPAEDVIYGTDGWLYYAETLDDYQEPRDVERRRECGRSRRP